MIAALSIACSSWILGLHWLAPWRLARAEEAPRRLWGQAALPALLAAGVVALFGLDARVDSALAWGLAWPPASLPALLLAVAAGAVALLDLLLLFAWREFDPRAWRLAALLGGLLLAASAFAGQLLQVGRGPMPGLAALLLGTFARLALAGAAAEATVARPRWLAPLAGLALPLSAGLYSTALREALGPELITLAAATALLLAARFVPAPFRRPAVAAALVLAALFLARAGVRSNALEPPLRLPDAFLPEP